MGRNLSGQGSLEDLIGSSLELETEELLPNILYNPSLPWQHIKPSQYILRAERKSGTQSHLLQWLLAASPALGTSSGTVKPKAKRADPEHNYSPYKQHKPKALRDLGRICCEHGKQVVMAKSSS